MFRRRASLRARRRHICVSVQKTARNWTTVGRTRSTSPNICQTRPDMGRTRSERGRSRARLDRDWCNPGRNRPNFSRHRRTSLAEFHRCSAEFGHLELTIARYTPTWPTAMPFRCAQRGPHMRDRRLLKSSMVRGPPRSACCGASGVHVCSCAFVGAAVTRRGGGFVRRTRRPLAGPAARPQQFRTSTARGSSRVRRWRSGMLHGRSESANFGTAALKFGQTSAELGPNSANSDQHRSIWAQIRRSLGRIRFTSGRSRAESCIERCNSIDQLVRANETIGSVFLELAGASDIHGVTRDAQKGVSEVHPIRNEVLAEDWLDWCEVTADRDVWAALEPHLVQRILRWTRPAEPLPCHSHCISPTTAPE